MKTVKFTYYLADIPLDIEADVTFGALADDINDADPDIAEITSVECNGKQVDVSGIYIKLPISDRMVEVWQDIQDTAVFEAQKA